MIRKILYHLTHNILFNNLIILLHLENRFKSSDAVWKRFKFDPKKSLQENVGFSHREDVEKAIQIIHEDLKEVFLQNKDHIKNILDIGCGTGLYLKDFEGSGCKLYGIDLSDELLKAATEHVPTATFLNGHYLNYQLSEKMDLIYMISVLEYISRNDLDFFFKKVYDDLNPGGIVFIQYPHALSKKDLYYPDLNYIKYSPELIEKTASRLFQIIRHSHGYHKDKKVEKYDQSPFNEFGGSFVNGYVLIAKRGIS